MDNIVDRLNVIEQEQAEYIEKEVNEEEATIKSHENTEKESYESYVWQREESKETKIPEYEPDHIESEETSFNAVPADQEHKHSTSNTKENISNKCLEIKFKCP